MASSRERYERQAEARRQARRAQRAVERRARRRRIGVVALLVLVVAGAGTGIGFAVSGSGAKNTPTAAAGCTYTADPATQTAKSPGLPPDRKATGRHTLTIRYGQGTVVASLDPTAPCTINSFQWLAGKGFFTNTICHRLTTSGIYVLQCGDPTGTGSGGPGYTIPDENLTGATYPAGTLAMANTGAPNSGGSQFFLVYKASQLSASYTPFGTITSGLPVLTAIAKAGTANGSGDGKPKATVKILSFTIS